MKTVPQYHWGTVSAFMISEHLTARSCDGEVRCCVLQLSGPGTGGRWGHFSCQSEPQQQTTTNTTTSTAHRGPWGYRGTVIGGVWELILSWWNLTPQTCKHVWQWRTCVTRCARPGCRCWCGRWWRWRRRGPATASPCCWGRTSTSPAQCTTSTSWPTGTRTKLPSIIRWVNSFQQRGTCDKILLSWVKFQFSYLTSLGWFWPQRARDDYQWKKYWPDILWDILCTKWWDMRPQQDRNCTRPLLPAGFPQSFTRKS